MNDKKILGAIYRLKTQGCKSGAREVAEEVASTAGGLGAELERLEREGLVRRSGDGGFELTPTGRGRIRVVMIGGAFEIIHLGHIHTISQAKKLGDLLVAVVATDKTVAKNKRRSPVTDERKRVELVASIRYVDLAVLGSEKSIYDTLEKVRPDVVALGYDQHHSESEIEKEAERRGFRVKVKRLDSPVPEIKTSKIVSEFT